jgi:hypothetical protein
VGTNLSQVIKQYGTVIIEMRKTRQGHAVIRCLSFGEFDGHAYEIFKKKESNKVRTC